MKIILSVLALLAATLGGSASAAEITSASQTASTLCNSYKIPIQSTVVACGIGMVGTKYKTSSFDCNTGKASESTDYDTSGCVSTAGQAGGVLSDTRKCLLTPDACGTKPAASACPIGQHWSLAGSGIAHCVPDDPVCAWGASVKYDAIGNPSCVINGCTGGKVLQGDGVSCACPVNTVLTGDTCTAAPPTCVPGYLPVVTTSCPDGYTGYQTRQDIRACQGGSYGTPMTVFGSTDSSKCVSQTVICNAGTTQENGTCSAGYTGTKYRNVTTTCPNGSYSAPVLAYGAWVDNCVSTGVCTAATKYSTSACPAPMVGTMAVTTKTTCPGPVVTVTENSANCQCENNAIDMPTCTPPYMTYGCMDGSSTPGCVLNPPPCAGASWNDGSGNNFCVTKPSVAITKASLKAACGGKTSLPEVRLFQTQGGWQRVGYACSVPSNTLYGSSGLELNPPVITVPTTP